MAERKGLTKKIRFEVFKRDSFTCQYCGKSAPSVVLEVDHIKPVSKDGDNEITNLITSCKDCNAGKSDRELSDDTVMAKRKSQLDELQERREQIEMMMEWQVGLDITRDNELNNLVDYINSKMIGYTLNEGGIKRLKLPLRKYGFSEMLESTSISADQYILYDKDGNQIVSSLEKYLAYIQKIASCRKSAGEKPYLMDLFYINGILRNILGEQVYGAVSLLEEAYLKGISIQKLKELAINSESSYGWTKDMEELIDE